MPASKQTDQVSVAGEGKRSVRDRLGARTWTFLILAIVAILLFLIVNIPAVTTFFQKFGGHVAPIVVGAVIAYLCTPVLRFYEYRVFRRMKHNGARRGISLALTMITALATLALIVMMIVPQLVRSIQDLVSDYETYLNDMLRFVQNLLDKLTANLPVEINISSKEHLMEFLTNMYGSVEDFYDKVLKPIIGKWDAGHFAWNAVGDVFVYIKNFVLGLFIAFYILASKEKRIGQVNKFRKAMFKPETDSKITSFVALVDKSFGGFISGKILDAVIITLINFIVFGLARIPYYPLVSLVCGVTDVIPYFGPFIGAVPCAFIILIADPVKMIWFVVLTLVIQQCDGNIIGPKILGEKVGVDSLMIVVAITISGGLWGLVGMFIGVPLFAVLRQAVKELVESRLQKKHLPVETAAYYDVRKEETAE